MSYFTFFISYIIEDIIDDSLVFSITDKYCNLNYRSSEIELHDNIRHRTIRFETFNFHLLKKIIKLVNKSPKCYIDFIDINKQPINQTIVLYISPNALNSTYICEDYKKIYLNNKKYFKGKFKEINRLPINVENKNSFNNYLKKIKNYFFNIFKFLCINT